MGAVLLGTLAVIGSGCFRSDVSYVLHNDRSGSVTHSTTIELPVLRAGDSTNGQAAAAHACEQFLNDSRDDRSSTAIFGTLSPSVETTNNGAECSETLQASWTSDEFKDVVEAIAESGGARITNKSNGVWDFRLEWPPEGAEIWQRNTYVTDETAGALPKLGISVDLPPGGMTMHNSPDLWTAAWNLGSSSDTDDAGRSDDLAVLGGSFTWERSLGAPRNESGSLPYEMFAQTHPNATEIPTDDVLWAVGLVLLLVVALLIPFLSRWRSGRAESAVTEDSYRRATKGISLDQHSHPRAAARPPEPKSSERES